MSDQDDSELIVAIQRRDPAALMSLYDRYRGIAFALAYRILNDAGAAEEAVQDAFMQVWRRADLYDPARGSGLRAWLLKIVHNRAIDLLRRRNGGTGSAIDLETVEFIPAVDDVQREVTATLEQDEVRVAVAALPAAQRETIHLAYFEGLTHQEIADRTQTPLGTVKGRLRLGLRKLAESLTEVGQTA